MPELLTGSPAEKTIVPHVSPDDPIGQGMDWTELSLGYANLYSN